MNQPQWVAIAGTLFLLGNGVFLCPALAQAITPAADGTGTAVNQNGTAATITGGTTTGGNLFHSFTDFSVPQGHSATFLADPAILNILGRVTGGNPSLIDGLLQVSGSNANLFLLNPAGILFGANSVLNLNGSFTAATADGVTFATGTWNALGTPDYTTLVGDPTGFIFSSAHPGAVVNAGTLAVNAGESVTLLGGQVINTGAIAAPGGNILITAVEGESLVRIAQEGLLLNLEVATLPSGAGTPQPLTPATLPELLTGNGITTASGVTVNPDGTVTLTGSDVPLPNQAGTAIAAGTLDVSQPNAGSGGTLTVLGQTIGLLAANLNAAGANGGGTIRVGGDYQGQGTLPQAAIVYIDGESRLSADSLIDGVGGTIIAWSNATTRVYGDLSARGGTQGGDGGLIETSSRGYLDVGAVPDVSAPSGNGGLWLLDPDSIQLVNAPGSNFNQSSPPPPTIFSPASPFTPSIIRMADLNTALGFGNVEVRTNPFNASFTDGNIRIVDNFDFDSTAGNTLFLRAVGDIQIDADIRSATGVNFNFLADSDGNGNGQLTVTGGVGFGDAINTTGNISLRGFGANGVIINAPVVGNNISIVGFGNAPSFGAGVIVDSTVLGSGNVTIQGAGTGDGVRFVAGSTSASGNLTVLGAGSNGIGVNVLEVPLSAGNNLVLQGSSSSATGVYVAFSSLFANSILLNGSSVSSDGVFFDNFGLSTSSLSLIGRSQSGFAVRSPTAIDVFAGNINIASLNGNILLQSVDASGSEFPGGNISISTPGFLRVLGTNEGGQSIATSGGASIRIQHGGNGITPFTVGNASVNGTAGSISNGVTTIAPTQQFFTDEIRGNIAIVTTSDICYVGCDDSGDDFGDDFEDFDGDFEIDFGGDDFGDDFDFGEWDFGDDFLAYFDLPDVPEPNFESAQDTLQDLANTVGVPPALVYVRFSPSQPGDVALRASRLKQTAPLFEANPNDVLELLLVTPTGQPQRIRVPGATREKVTAAVRQLQLELTDRTRRRQTAYLGISQQLYGWLVAPLEATMAAEDIGHLSFIMAPGVRSLPLAALHDGNQFIIEKYTVGLMPSLGLTDTRYTDIRNAPVLAMGASQFTDQPNLPAVPFELSTIVGGLRPGESWLNETFTPEVLVNARRAEGFPILHLATHGEFRSGGPSNSYIQFWNQRLGLDQIRQLGLNDPPLELLVMSACRTALGDTSAELGFAGLAVQSGVKSALATLWQVSDLETAGLMAEFYTQLSAAPYKAEALRAAQLAMLRGDVTVQGGKLIWSGGEQPLPPELQGVTFGDTTHPYYWAAFTLVGSPW